MLLGSGIQRLAQVEGGAIDHKRLSWEDSEAQPTAGYFTFPEPRLSRCSPGLYLFITLLVMNANWLWNQLFYWGEFHGLWYT